MKPFTYQLASSVPDALQRYEAAPHAAFLAGGTNLLDHLKLGLSAPQSLVDISRLDLTQITELPGGGLSIGAMVKNSDMAAHPLIRRRYPFVAQALLAGASGQLRNMATTGGNLLQRTRCPYFQDLTTPCNKRVPGTGCSALEGFGRYNAIFGASSACVAVHPSDLCIPLAALDAVVVVQGQQGERRIHYGEFHRLPAETPQLDTNLAPGELITALELAPLPCAAHSHYRKVRDRASYAFALVSVAAALEVRAGVISEVRLGLGGVSHKPHRARVAEEMLRGKPATAEHFAAAAAAELAAAVTCQDNAFKVPMLQNTIVAVLSGLAKADLTQSDLNQSGGGHHV